MDVFNVIRITAVVGLSAIKVISAVLKAKEANRAGLINHPFAHANNHPYYNQPMTNGYGNPPVNNQMYVPVQPQYQCPQYSAPTPQPPVVESRRNWTPNFPSMPCMNMGYDMPMVDVNQYGYNMMSRRSASVPVMAPVVNNTGMVNSNGSYWRSYYANTRNTNDTFGYRNPQYSNTYPGKELQWADRTIGQMTNEMEYYQPSVQPQKKWTPMFNWNNPLLRHNSQREANEGIVAMFYTNDGKPLFGPFPAMVPT